MIGISRTPRRSMASAICALAAACVLSGCDRGQIQVYRVPKQTAGHTHDAPGSGGGAAHGEGAQSAAMPTVRYQAPAGWTDLGPKAMRVARFTVPGPEGLDADISVIPLPAMVGNERQVIDLWRDSIQLTPLPAGSPLPSETVPVGEGSGLFVDMTSTTNLFKGTHPARIVAVIHTRGPHTWFIKMMGAGSHLATLIEPFKAFVAGLVFDADPHPAPVAAATGSAPVPSGSSGGEGEGLPGWTIPAGWRSEAAPAMAMAGFSVGQDAARANISVTRLAGDGGGAFPNIQRWRGQLGLPEVPEKELAGQVERVSVAGTEAMVVDITGTDRRSGQPSRMVGAIVLLGGNSWFFKMQGDPATVEKEKGPFVEFVRTARYPNG